MTEQSFVRIRVPRHIKAGETIRVRTLAVHPMEGIMRDAKGNVISRAYSFIYKCTVFFNDRQVLTITPTQSVSANPYFSFPLQVTGPGVLKVVFEDSTNGRFEDTKQIELG